MTIVLDVAIGVTFLYLLLALIVTTVQELVASALRLRAQNLYQALEGMLKGEAQVRARDKTPAVDASTLLAEVYAHPLIKNLRGKRLFSPSELALPSYIPSKTFALALLDVLRRRSSLAGELGATKLLKGAREAVAAIADHADLKHALELIFEQAEVKATRLDEEVELVTSGIETWFNDRMSRASGWYARKAQLLSLVLGLAVTAITNADSTRVVSALWHNGALREAVASSAQVFYDRSGARPAGSATLPESEPPAALDRATVSKPSGADALQALNLSKLPVGWEGLEFTDPKPWPLRLLGWIITTLAVSLGAGFWFDALGGALGLRKTGPKVSAATGRVEDDD
jgi:hypothetical protein